MFTLFNNSPNYRRGNAIPPEIAWIRQGMLLQFEKVMDFYHNHTYNVGSSHLLVQLITSVTAQTNRDYQRYVDTVSDQTYQLAMAMRLTSPLQRGRITNDSVFYGRDIHEIILINDEDFSVKDAVANWQNLQPVKVLRHPFNDLTMPLLIGNYPYRKQGIAVVSINLSMLMLQYRLWNEQQMASSYDAKETVQQFVAEYPIPNMLYTHFDHAVFNRMCVLLENGIPDSFVNPHSFALVDYSPKIDPVFKKILDYQESRNFTFADVMVNIPLFYHSDLFELMLLPKGPKTRQIVWALLIARLPVIKFLLELTIARGNQANTMNRNDLIISLRAMRADKELMAALPPYLLEEVEDDIRKHVLSYL